ncbi:DDE Tnp4 domain-containing protein [Mycena chlorophos]|uniref:DDE Tnp4 domain-containing protein n=1 Tax=Mycena chlorophos TaxID=658473 RepID=A0A8H6TQ66_MYCCL|nr:DDE Tnp4 domain-containing protein [Mycena chlorophos]
MPAASRRGQRVKRLLRSYISYVRAKKRRQMKRQKLASRIRADHPQPRKKIAHSPTPSLSSLSSESISDSDSEDSSESDEEDAEIEWDKLLGEGWRLELELLGADLEPTLSESSYSEESSSASSSSDSLSSAPAFSPISSESGSDGSDDDSHDPLRRSRPRRFIEADIDEMYASRYEEPREHVPRPEGEPFIRHLLTTLKSKRADHFRAELRVNPSTFDALVRELEDDPVFHNNSNTAQAAVDLQLAVALYRFGHDGNASSLQSVANWARLGKGTVHLWTRRIMVAVLRPQFKSKAVCLPTEEEKEEAKEWVEGKSCVEAGDMGGALSTARSFHLERVHFGKIPVINLPNLQIIDFGYGHVGSAHDAVAWRTTYVAQEHGTIFKPGEWIWGDSAYPISSWLTAPYKSPLRELPDNEKFNNHVSILRIRSEHAIGYLKGRFHSLKKLRLRISDATTHKIATLWVSACIIVHAFAQRHERESRADGESDSQDLFISEGLEEEESDDEFMTRRRERAEPTDNRSRLAEGKRFPGGLEGKAVALPRTAQAGTR